MERHGVEELSGEIKEQIQTREAALNEGFREYGAVQGCQAGKAQKSSKAGRIGRYKLAEPSLNLSSFYIFFVRSQVHAITMDAIDRLESGLFFCQLNTTNSPLSPTNSRSVHKADDAGSAYDAYVPPPNTHTHGPGHAPQIPMPLLSVSADVDVHGRLCTTKITQKFSNTSSSTAENAKYIFPVYDGSVVTSFRCWVGNDKLLEGTVKVKEAARTDFQHALSQHKVAVLVEELVPEVFETNVGNIPGQKTVKIEIIYTNLLKVDSSTGGLVLTIPSSIAPRYGVAPEGYSAQHSLLTEGLRVNVQASMPGAIRKMESRSHPISVEIGAVAHYSFSNFAAASSSETFDPSKGRATLGGTSVILDRDFVLYILCSSRESTKSQALAATQPDQPVLSTVAITIHPRDLFLQHIDTEKFEGEIIFVADRSFSMESKIRSLINVMNVFLRSLPSKCSFNIASFGDRFAWLWPSSKQYSQENLDIASRHVGSFDANFGGTEIYPALQSVLDCYNTRSDVPTSVILLTDGEIWDVDNVIELVRGAATNQESNIRFFSIGIGDQVSHRLVEGIGQQGGGYAEVVPESSMGAWQERVIQMLKAALTPSRLQCEVDFGQGSTTKSSERQVSGYTVHYPEMIKAPHHIPVLSTFSYFTLYCMLEGELESLPTTVTVSAMTDKGEKLTTQIPLWKVAGQTAIHHLAAKALMDDYETGKSWLHTLNSDLKSTNPAAFDKILEQQAQQLGQKWSITGKWTSYVAIDHTSAQDHEISLQKAESIEISRLNRPWHTPNLNPRFLADPRRDAAACRIPIQESFQGSNSSSYSSQETSPRLYISHRATAFSSSEYEELCQKSKIDGSMFNPCVCYEGLSDHSTEDTEGEQPNMRMKEQVSLYEILFTQAADGRFHLNDFMLSDALRREGGILALEQFLAFLCEKNPIIQTDPEFEILCLNIIAVMYIKYQHRVSQSLWELQVAKARQWIKQKMMELLKKSGIHEPEISLEELEGSLIKELEEKSLEEKPTMKKKMEKRQRAGNLMILGMVKMMKIGGLMVEGKMKRRSTSYTKSLEGM